MDGRRAWIGLVLALALWLPTAPSQAQKQDPSPKELWDAYPLQPGETPAVPTPGSDIPAPTPAAAEPRDAGTPWTVPLAGLTAVGALSFVLLRRRRAQPEPAAAPTASNVERLTIEWRVGPPPPAPPAPPPPVNGAKR